MVGRHQYGGTSSASMSAAAAGKLPNKLLWRMQLQQPCLSLSQREVAESITSWIFMIFDDIHPNKLHFIVHPLYFKHHQIPKKHVFDFWMFCVSFCLPLVALRSWPWNPTPRSQVLTGSSRPPSWQKSLQSLPSKYIYIIIITFSGGKKHSQLKYRMNSSMLYKLITTISSVLCFLENSSLQRSPNWVCSLWDSPTGRRKSVETSRKFDHINQQLVKQWDDRFQNL